MVFELDTDDMERHAVELRRFVEKARRRFSKANMSDTYEKIIKNMLPKAPDGQENLENFIQIDTVDNEEARRLNAFLERVIGKCTRPEQHESLQTTLRNSLLNSRRRSIAVDESNGTLKEPLCYFCGSDESRCQSNLPLTNDQANYPNEIFDFVPHVEFVTQHGPLTPPLSLGAPTPDFPVATCNNAAAAAEEAQHGTKTLPRKEQANASSNNNDQAVVSQPDEESRIPPSPVDVETDATEDVVMSGGHEDSLTAFFEEDNEKTKEQLPDVVSNLSSPLNEAAGDSQQTLNELVIDDEQVTMLEEELTESLNGKKRLSVAQLTAEGPMTPVPTPTTPEPEEQVALVRKNGAKRRLSSSGVSNSKHFRPIKKSDSQQINSVAELEAVGICSQLFKTTSKRNKTTDTGATVSIDRISNGATTSANEAQTSRYAGIYSPFSRASPMATSTPNKVAPLILRGVLGKANGSESLTPSKQVRFSSQQTVHPIESSKASSSQPRQPTRQLKKSTPKRKLIS